MGLRALNNVSEWSPHGSCPPYLGVTVVAAVPGHAGTHSRGTRRSVHARLQSTQVQLTEHANEPGPTDAPPSLARSLVDTRHVETLVSFALVPGERRRTCAPRLTVAHVTRAPVQTRRLVAVAHVMGTRVTDEPTAADAGASLARCVVLTRYVETFVPFAEISRELRRAETASSAGVHVADTAMLARRQRAGTDVVRAARAYVLDLARAAVSTDLVDASTAVETRGRGAVVDVGLAVSPCNGRIGELG